MMESAISFAVAAIICAGLAALLGYWGQKWLGMVSLAFLALVAIFLCLMGAMLGYTIAGESGMWPGLIISIVVAGLVWSVSMRLITHAKRGGRFAANGWYSFAALAILGYLAGNWVGLLTLTLPTFLLFWGGLYFVAGRILPLRNPKDRVERRKAFRSLVTFNMGTNYPYYFVNEHSQLKEQVKGNSFLTLFAGPGFVYTDCDHIAYVSKGISVSGVFEPGLTFTGTYDLEPRILDLRPQLRAFPVEALTKDGIPIEVTTFIPCRIDTDDKTPQPGESFPFRKQAVYALLNHELVERKQEKKQSGKRHEWVGGPDDGLIPLISRPIVQDIIGRYTIDELCVNPDKPDQDPRKEIITELQQRMRAALEPLGLVLIGGGISNLEPKNDYIKERRLANWLTKLVSERLKSISDAQSNRTYLTEKARANAETKIVKEFREKIPGTGKMNLALTLRLIDTLGDIFSEQGQWPLLNDEIEKQLRELRGENTDLKRAKESAVWVVDD
jgi:regulator of protease activity HflC (stomatin/prohibitin superfamily)